MAAATISRNADVFLNALRTAGRKGLTGEELFDRLKIANPHWLAEELVAATPGMVIDAKGERARDGQVVRFTLAVDPQETLL